MEKNIEMASFKDDIGFSEIRKCENDSCWMRIYYPFQTINFRIHCFNDLKVALNLSFTTKKHLWFVIGYISYTIGILYVSRSLSGFWSPSHRDSFRNQRTQLRSLAFFMPRVVASFPWSIAISMVGEPRVGTTQVLEAVETG